ncbi:MAG: zinc metallopeptidase, partial [Pseudomonadota bacterium]|nr:zinc metallopeptidase [Pseudomonadota bacterium]
EEKRVVLCPRVFDGKSLTAVAVAAHEVGHAIQFVRREPVSQLRDKYLSKAFRIRKIGAVLLSLIPVAGAVFKVPALMLLFAAVAVLTMLASVAMYVAILPEEYDASFNKALPILQAGYVPENHMPAARQVLKAAAYTYVAAALADVLRLWRWIRFLR